MQTPVILPCKTPCEKIANHRSICTQNTVLYTCKNRYSGIAFTVIRAVFSHALPERPFT